MTTSSALHKGRRRFRVTLSTSATTLVRPSILRVDACHAHASRAPLVNRRCCACRSRRPTLSGRRPIAARRSGRFAARRGPSCGAGPPPPVALVSFTRKGARDLLDPTDPDAHEVGIVENGEWLWPVSRSAYPRGMTELVRRAARRGRRHPRRDPRARARVGDPIPVSHVDLLAPIPRAAVRRLRGQELPRARRRGGHQPPRDIKGGGALRSP